MDTLDYRTRRRPTFGTPDRQATRQRPLRLGYRVIRIWSNDIIEYLDGILQTLLSELGNTPSPRPSPRKRGERDDRGDYPSSSEDAIAVRMRSRARLV